jgi:tetratricopeptide (TPR) repeat protein
MNTKPKKPIFDRRSIFFSIAVLVLFVIQGLILWFRPVSGAHDSASSRSGQLRELGDKLKGAGVTEEAILQYERYLEQSDIPANTRANISYSLGRMCLELGKYDKALSWFYRVELADPNSDMKTEVNSKIVHCLERLGKFNAAQYVLESRTSIKGDSEAKTGAVAARIGQEEITLSQIDAALAEMPPWIVGQYKDKQKKVEFLQQYVARELLYRKAVKLEYDKDAGIGKKLQETLKDLMVQKLVKTEVEDKIKIDEGDLKNYYLANQDKYKDDKAEKPKSFEEVKAQVEQEYRSQKFQQAYQDLIQTTLKAEDVQLFPEVITGGK